MTSESLEIVWRRYERRESGDMCGATISQDVGAILTLRDGLIVRWEYYWERGDALEAAGIAE
jgi:ketosteroid isomerase-like protein